MGAYVISADTGMEFPEMYEHLAKVDDYLFRERGLHITRLRHPMGFEWMMFEEPKQRKASLENRARYGVPSYGEWLAWHPCPLVYRAA